MRAKHRLGFAMITITLLQLLTAAVATWALWRIVMSLRAVDVWTWRIAAVGLIARAVAAQALFWVAFFEVAPFRDLHDGNGVWFFGTDASVFMRLAGELAAGEWTAGGLRSVTASPVYVQSLAVMFLVAGSSVIAGVLLNFLAYAGTTRLLLWLAGDRPGVAARASVAFLAISPSLFLWSLQPLKDVLVAFLITAVIALLTRLYQLGRGDGEAPGRWRAIAGIACLAAVATYALAGIRWYVAFVIIAATALVGLAGAITSSRLAHRAGAIGAVAILFVALELVALSATPRLKDEVPRLLGFDGNRTRVSEIFSKVNDVLVGHRWWIAQLPAKTTILTGSALPEPHRLPTRPREILFTAATAWVIPHPVAQGLGWITVRTGAGVRTLAVLDTVVLDALLCWTAWLVYVAVRRRLRSPTAWVALTAALPLALGLMYTIPNLGTVVRHRGMVFILLLLFATAMARAWDDERSKSAALRDAPMN